MILAIDPGTTESAYCAVDTDYNLHDFGKIENKKMLEVIKNSKCKELAVEMVASYGMPVGREVFETCVWIGRYIQAASQLDTLTHTEYIYRKDEKVTICGTMKATDSTIRHALIDRFAKTDLKNGKGTKKQPDYFYGFKADIWQAFAVAITYIDKHKWEDKAR